MMQIMAESRSNDTPVIIFVSTTDSSSYCFSQEPQREDLALCVNFTVQSPVILLPQSQNETTHLRLQASSIAVKSTQASEAGLSKNINALRVDFDSIGLSLVSSVSGVQDLVGGLGVHIDIQSGINIETGGRDVNALIEAPHLKIEVYLCEVSITHTQSVGISYSVLHCA